MASTTIKWSSDEVLCSKKGSTYYSTFSTVSKDGKTQRQYRLGDCVPVKVNRRVAVMLAEVIELFVDDSDDVDDDEPAEKMKLRLYAYPQDTPSGRNYTHGEHELIMFYKHIVLSCKQFLIMEQTDVKWNCGVPLQPQTSSESSPPPSPTLSCKSGASSVTSLLYCHEPMVPVGLFEYEEKSGAPLCSSPIANRTMAATCHSDHPKIRIVSYPVYCRYRALLARLGGNSAYRYMSAPLVLSLGGIPVPNANTLMMFCRKTFRDITLERKLNFCVSKEVTFYTSNRRPSSSLSPSPPSTTSSENSSSVVTRSRSSKKGRGRPRKDQSESVKESIGKDTNGGSNKRHTRTFDCDSISSSKRSNCSDKEEETTNTSETDEESPIDRLPSSRKRNGQHFVYPSPKKQNNERVVDGVTEKHIVEPATVMPTDASAMTYPIYSPNPFVVDKTAASDNIGNHSPVTPLPVSSQSTNQSTLKTSASSNGSKVTNATTMVHSLRPRSSLLPPPQYRDESYDMDSDYSTSKSSTSSSTEATVDQTSQQTIDNSNTPSSPTTTTATAHETSSSENGRVTVPPTSKVSPVKTLGGVTVTKLPLNSSSPPPPPHPVYRSSKSVTPVDITQDVKELLKAYLSCLQATATSESWSGAINSHLEAHLINERQFLDLLFCFMRMRKTPIHRVPRLGSQNLNLFELYKVTTMLGGYEQVTINRKWSYVFDSLGCATGMTCASTVTRKHYEKLLLPFERALTAMKK